ncbi:MAG: 4-hydroxybenzoate polyprenyltransferase [Epsilonproteobacteria bacterium]|nr:4-hydroxybenzoate polyprenyltransferase [Campylobacterota bacterium]
MKETIKKLSELVMFKHSIFSLPFIFIAMIVASDGWFGWRLLFLGLIEAISARNFAMGVNRYLDRDIDRVNPRTKDRPSVDGSISTDAMVIFIFINGAIFMAGAYLINSLAFQLSAPILVILGGYSLFKRFSSLAHIVLGVSLGLAPIAGVIAVKGDITTWSIYLAVGVMFWVAGFDLLYSLQDMEFDREHNLHSIPSKFGAEKTMIISRVFHILTIIFWSLFIYSANLGFFSKLALIFSILMLTYEHYIVSRDFKKIDRAFFTVNGYLGIIFFILIVLEKM